MLLFFSIYSFAETCLKDVKRMEPIDGLSRINKVCLSLCFCVNFFFQSFCISVEISSFITVRCGSRTAGNLYAVFAEFPMEFVYRYITVG
jgi:hypothetical protein